MTWNVRQEFIASSEELINNCVVFRNFVKWEDDPEERPQEISDDDSENKTSKFIRWTVNDSRRFFIFGLIYVTA